MVHTVKDSINIRAEVRRSLSNRGKNKKEFFPKWIHREHTMRGIAMKEKCLGKEGEIPMSEQENQDCHNNDCQRYFSILTVQN